MYVSNLGHCRDVHRQSIPQYVSENGYMTVQTAHGYSFVHRIVMKTWHPVVDMDHLTVDHLDHNKRNNSMYNLEWVTRNENLTRARNDRLSFEGEKQLDTSSEESTSVELRATGRKFNAYKGSNAHQFSFSCLLLDEAINWYKKNEPSVKNATEAQILKGISHSLSQGSQYAGYIWKYE